MNHNWELLISSNQYSKVPSCQFLLVLVYQYLTAYRMIDRLQVVLRCILFVRLQIEIIIFISRMLYTVRIIHNRSKLMPLFVVQPCTLGL